MLLGTQSLVATEIIIYKARRRVSVHTGGKGRQCRMLRGWDDEKCIYASEQNDAIYTYIHSYVYVNNNTMGVKAINIQSKPRSQYRHAVLLLCSE